MQFVPFHIEWVEFGVNFSQLVAPTGMHHLSCFLVQIQTGPVEAMQAYSLSFKQCIDLFSSVIKLAQNVLFDKLFQSLLRCSILSTLDISPSHQAGLNKSILLLGREEFTNDSRDIGLEVVGLLDCFSLFKLLEAQ